MTDESDQQQKKKKTKFTIAENVQAEVPKRPKPKDTDSSSDPN